MAIKKIQLGHRLLPDPALTPPVIYGEGTTEALLFIAYLNLLALFRYYVCTQPS